MAENPGNKYLGLESMAVGPDIAVHLPHTENSARLLISLRHGINQHYGLDYHHG